MEYIGDSEGYNLYRNKEGFIEAYKKKGKRMVGNDNVGTGLSHIITNCTTVQEFDEFISCNKKPSKIKPDQPTLFDPSL